MDVADDPIGVRSRLGYMPEHDCLPLDQTAADVVATFGELSGLPAAGGPPAGVGHPRPRRSRRGPLPPDRRLLHRHAPAHEAGPGARRRPGAVLLDEPTAGLDPLGREEMLALVARLGTFGISVLMATHLLDDVQQVCDHVVMIDAGRLVVSGATDSLLERTGQVTVDVGVALAEALVDRRRTPSALPAVGVDGLVEVTIDGDADLDRRCATSIAELGLPLYRLSTRAHVARRGVPRPRPA